jgi:transcriptional regulator with XRE-family HTH domain
MWHGIIADSWRDVIRTRKRELGLSNAKLAELVDSSESAVARDLADKSDPPLSHIVALAAALDVPLSDLFSPNLPNGMKLATVMEDYARVTAENIALKEENTALRANVEELRDKVDTLKDEIIETHRHYIKLR